MGAMQFEHWAEGKDAKDAFNKAIEEAYYDWGHSGYTGTIAEKDSFIMIEVPEDFKEKPHDYVEYLLYGDDERISDKWGPAGCIEIEKGQYVFFGWASS